jgi:hypothetical protein
MKHVLLLITVIMSCTCGGIVVIDPASEAPTLDASMDAGPDAPTLDASMDAGPDADAEENCDSPVKGAFNCCEEKPCRGYCHVNFGCLCGTISGGCPAPTICCGEVCGSELLCQ